MPNESFDFDFRPESYWDDDESYWDPGDEEWSEHVCIASLVMETTLLGSVISVLASPRGGRIHYQVLDDCLDTVYEVRPKTSKRPLTFRQVTRLIDSFDGGEAQRGPIGILEENAQYVEPEELSGFIQVGSGFYPELGKFYEQKLQGWIDGEVRSREQEWARLDREEDRKEKQRRAEDVQLKPLLAEIAAIVEIWRDASGCRQRRAVLAWAKSFAVEEFIRQYALANGELPQGIHIIRWRAPENWGDWPYQVPKKGTLAANFSKLAETARDATAASR
ncbi:MAG: hypothetical protein VCB43_02495 [Myxococcota bacterium]